MPLGTPVIVAALAHVRTTRSQEGKGPLEGSDRMLGPGRAHKRAPPGRNHLVEGTVMAAERGTGGNTGGIGLGGILVIVGPS